MPLPIRDGNQSLTTLSTLLVNSAHVPAHTVVSLGSQAITDIAGAVSGVELGPNTLNALENIHVSISAGSSITIGNVVSVTGGLTNSELRASPVTIGGSVSISNFPEIQAVTFTQAPVTFGQAIVSASNIGLLNSSVATDGVLGSSLNFIKIGGHQDGSNQTAHIVHVSSGGAMKVDATDSSITFGAITGSVSVLNFPATQAVTFGQASVTFGTSAVTGSVSVLNLPAIQTVTFTQASVTFGQTSTTFGAITGSVSILGTPSVTGTVELGPNSLNALENITVTMGSVTVTGGLTDSQLRASPVTIGGSVSISGAVTANTGLMQPLTDSQLRASAVPISLGGISTQGTSDLRNAISGSVVSISNFPATQTIAGTVTANIGNSVSISSNTSYPVIVGGSRLGSPSSLSLDSSGRLEVTATGTISVVNSPTVNIGNAVTISSVPAISGTVTVSSLPASTVTVSSLPAISGTVTVSSLPASTVTVSNKVQVIPDLINPLYSVITSESIIRVYDTYGQDISVNTDNGGINASLVNSVTIGALPAISGTVTVSSLPASTVTVSSLPAISGTVTAHGLDYRLLGGSSFSGAPTSGSISSRINVSSFALGTDCYFYVNQVGMTWDLRGSLSDWGGGPSPWVIDVTPLNSTVTQSTVTAQGWYKFTVATGSSSTVRTNFVAFAYVSGTFTGTSISSDFYAVPNATNWLPPENIQGTVTVGNSVTIGSLPSISGTVTANINGTVPISISSVTIGNAVTIASFATSVTAIQAIASNLKAQAQIIDGSGSVVTYASTGTAGVPSSDVISVQGISGGTNLNIVGTVTANVASTTVTISSLPKGALTTRFGSVTTANTAEISSAVTNTSRNYLLIQNVTTSSNVITIGIGFTPTTTQGIQLAAGAGITFESSYIPTGAVYVLSSVTASPFTILEA